MTTITRRTRATRFIALDTHACEACWRCLDSCHRHVLGRVDFFFHRHAVLANPDRCTGCLQCVKACSHGALTSLPPPPLPSKAEMPAAAAPPHRTFNRRGFAAVALVLSCVILAWSGVENHVVQFAPWGRQRHFWMAVHNAAAFVFTFSAVLHGVLNGKALLRHLRTAGTFLVSREAISAIGIVLGIVGLVALHTLLGP